MANGNSSSRLAREERIIARAVSILERRFLSPRGERIDGIGAARRYCAMKLAGRRREAMLAFWMDADGHVLAIEEVGAGTITQVLVHPRELVRSALEHNACRLILAHNHPTGKLEFSDADRRLTEGVRAAMKLIDVRLDDHLLVGDGVLSLLAVETHEQLEREESERRDREERAAARRAGRMATTGAADAAS